MTFTGTMLKVAVCVRTAYENLHERAKTWTNLPSAEYFFEQSDESGPCETGTFYETFEVEENEEYKKL